MMINNLDYLIAHCNPAHLGYVVIIEYEVILSELVNVDLIEKDQFAEQITEHMHYIEIRLKFVGGSVDEGHVVFVAVGALQDVGE